MLKEQGSHSLADALVNVSGVRATKPQEALFAQPIVRGFPAEIYMNGLPAFGGTAASIDPTSLIGTERIEVLKGPTSALYGGGKGLGFGVGITALSARELTLPNTVSVPGYALLDAQTSYDFDRYTISVSAVNLTGRKVFETFQYMGSPVVLPTQPRSAYLTLTTRF